MPSPSATARRPQDQDLDEQCGRLLRTIRVWARQVWHAQGQQCPLEEYEDAGREALTRCLARFDETRGACFRTYAQPRIAGAIQDAAGPYQTWRVLGRRGLNQLRARPHATALRPLRWDEARVDTASLVQALPPTIRVIADRLLAGETQAAIATWLGVSESAISHRLRRWRQRPVKLRLVDADTIL